VEHFGTQCHVVCLYSGEDFFAIRKEVNRSKSEKLLLFYLAYMAARSHIGCEEVRSNSDNQHIRQLWHKR
jgi:hypothetical protein